MLTTMKEQSAPSICPKTICFVCGKVYQDRMLRLLTGQTSMTKTVFAIKLQEMLNNRMFLNFKEKDQVCWNCSELLNEYDSLMFSVNRIKETIFKSIMQRSTIQSLLNQLEDGQFEGAVEEFSFEVASNAKSNTIQSSTSVGVARAKGGPQSKQTNVVQSATPKKRDVETKDFKFSNNVQHISQINNGVKKEKLAKIKCRDCSEIFCSKYELHQHINKRHPATYQCSTCSHPFNNFTIYVNHIKLHMMAHEDNLFKCKTCNFHSQHLEVYCGHECNFNTDLIQCPACKKKQIVDNQTVIKGFKCKNCTHKKKNVQRSSTSQKILEKEDYTSANKALVVSVGKDSDEVFLENIKDNQMIKEDFDLNKDDTGTETYVVSEDVILNGGLSQYDTLLKCSNCEEIFPMNQLTNHKCFVEGKSLEYIQFDADEEEELVNCSTVKNNSATSKTVESSNSNEPVHYHKTNVLIDENISEPRLKCNTCLAEFPSIVLMREHWSETGHPWDISTVNVAVKTIKEKHQDKGAPSTVKVVKQQFCMKASVSVPDRVYETSYTDSSDFFNIKNLFVRTDINECETCGQQVAGEREMKKHKMACRVCLICALKFLSNDLLKKHIRSTGHWKKKEAILSKSEVLPEEEEEEEVIIEELNLQEDVQCPICSNHFMSRKILAKHLKKHYRGTNAACCAYCFFQFERKSDLKSHLVQDHDHKPFFCNYCKEVFLSDKVRQRHIILKHVNDIAECSICKLQVKNLAALSRHKERYHRKLTCQICDKKIENWKKLKRHERHHFETERLKCNPCKRIFKNISTFRNHNLLLHSDENVDLKCKKCLAKFKNQKDLKSHMNSQHVTSLACPRCNKIFFSKYALFAHSKTHVPATICRFCDRIFRDTSLLSVHLKNKHNYKKRYICPHCKMAFSCGSTLKRHIDRVHGNENFGFHCKICRMSFKHKSSFKRHCTRKHGEQFEYSMKMEKTIIQRINNVNAAELIFETHSEELGHEPIIEFIDETNPLQQPPIALTLREEDLLQVASLISGNPDLMNELQQQQQAIVMAGDQQVVIEASPELFQLVDLSSLQ